MAAIYVYPSEKFFNTLENVSQKTTLPDKFLDLLKLYKKCRKVNKGKKGGKKVEIPKLRVSEVKELYAIIKDLSPEIYLHEMLREAKVEFPSPEIKPRDPELEKRIEKLKFEQENNLYKRMVNGIDPRFGNKETSVQSLNQDVKELRANLITIINFALTVVGSFFFGFKMVEYALPSPLIAAQVLVGIVLASIVAIADLYFIIKYLPE